MTHISSRHWVINGLILASLLFGAVFMPAPVLASPSGAVERESEYHVVRPGETLTQIAQQYGVTVYALMKTNMITDPNTIYISQRLVIPSDGMESGHMGGDMTMDQEMDGEMGKSECRTYHTVQPHESGFDIARDYEVSSYSLVQANGLVDINTVYGGMKLCIPNTPHPVNEQVDPMPEPGKMPPMGKPDRPMQEPMEQPMKAPMAEAMPMQEGMCTYHMVRKGETLSDIAMRYGVSLYQIMKLNNISNPNVIDAGQKLRIECGDGWMPDPKPMPMAEPMPRPMPMHMPDKRPMPEPMPMPEQRPMPQPDMNKGMQKPAPMPMPERGPMSGHMPPMEGHKGWTEIEQGPWRGYYYCDKYFGGEPVIVREDYDIRFNWRGGSPGEMVPEDRFSAKWERTAKLDGGWYRWVATVDDGIRIYVDDQLVLDAWREQPATEYTADFYVKPGYHKFRVEYYEESNMASISVKLERR